MPERVVTIIGGGLAGCEAAWQAARRGCVVRLFEMRPAVRTPAHQTDRLAELVCSNSLKSESLEDASGLLKVEMRALGSLLLTCAEAHRVPAGSALAVDRERFAAAVTETISSHPLVQVLREEMPDLPEARPVIVATGPLTSDRLSTALLVRFDAFLGRQDPAGDDARWLYFYDAISPIVSADSIDHAVVFAASRYGKGGADYLNCPLTPDEYLQFREAVLKGERYPLHEFEARNYFEGCLPIEELAERGEDTLRFGPMRPVGLKDPRTGRRPYAVVQLRQENRGADGRPTMYNLVGMQTRLRRGDQLKAFRLIPGLHQAEMLRYGSLHRNTFILAPLLLDDTLQFRGDPSVFIAGQLTGVEGYLESAATGLLAGINAVRLARDEPPCTPPATTMLGALLRYITQADPKTFQPINANFGLLPPLAQVVRDRSLRNRLLVERALSAFRVWHQGLNP
ncbi:MAG TPA: methylenetetrahydrofolate--tRNA-(uracil(54)-C(5))-methyltransferase (FADH(2)-oxidizing) TrmFO [Candidatus Methylomirabilis sp.]